MAARATRAAQRRRTAQVVAIVAAYLVSFAFVLRHALYGVDLQDEAYYLELARRFATGDTPVRSEASLHQFAALIEIPLVKAYLMLHGSTDGIVLFSRIAYVCVLACAILATVWSLKRLMGLLPAFLVCLPLVFFEPMAIAALSYNSISALAFLLCCTWGLDATIPGSGTGSAVASGVLGGVAAFAYPPLLIAVIPTIGILAVRSGRIHGVRRTWTLVGACAAVLLIEAVALAHWGLRDLAADINLMLKSSARYSSGYGPQLSSILDRVTTVLAGAPVAAILLVGAVASVKRAPRLEVLFLLGLPIAVFVASLGSWMQANTALWLLGLCAIGLYWGVRDELHARNVLWALVLPGLMAGAVVSFSSFIGEAVAGQGMLPAAVASIVFGWWMLASVASDDEPVVQQVLPALFPVVLALGFGLIHGSSVFHDPAALREGRLVRIGPWAGLRTTAERVKYVETLQRDLGQLSSRNRPILALDGIPGAYLAAEGVDVAPMIWIPYAGEARASIVQRVEQGRSPDIVVQDTSYTTPTPVPDPFAVYLRDGRYRVVITRRWYQVYVRK